MHFRTLAIGMFTLLSVAEASAQTCLGLPSFAEGPYQASLGLAFTEGAQTFGGGAAIGSDDIFGGASLAFTNFSETDSNATSFGFEGGATFVLNERERIEACPVGSVIVTGGPDVADVDITGIGLRAGGRIGVVAVESGSWEVVPTFGFDIAYDRISGELGAVKTTISRETYAIVRAGVGFVLNKRIGLLPTLSVPLGLDDSDPEFSFVVAYTFGQR
jgi:hypothetical protein